MGIVGFEGCNRDGSIFFVITVMSCTIPQTTSLCLHKMAETKYKLSLARQKKENQKKQEQVKWKAENGNH